MTTSSTSYNSSCLIPILFIIACICLGFILPPGIIGWFASVVGSETDNVDKEFWARRSAKHIPRKRYRNSRRFGMEASGSGRERTHEELTRIIVVLVVIIVVLSALATILFIQMEDYRGAKYRSQLEICVDIQNTLMDCGIKISWVLDYPPDSTLASYGALVSSLDADRLHHSFVEVAVMYPSHQ